MKKLTLITLLSTITAAPAFAAPGDTSTGSAVFSGFVPGFVANGDILVTGAGGNTDSASYQGTLQVNSDGTFETTKPVVLEAHDYTGAVLGAKVPANWTVSQVTVLPAAMAEVQPNIVVGDMKTTKPVVLEAHDYTGAVLGAKVPANWTVSQVNVLPAAMVEVQPNIVVGDMKTTTELTNADILAATQLSAGEDIQLYVANQTAHSVPDDIIGTEVIVNVDMIATLP